jgi:site-specific DNA recombinase
MKTQKFEKPKNDVVYIRVSSQEQVLGFSLGNQEKFCRDFSEKGGYSVFNLFREEGESAKTADRTELQKMKLFCEKNRKQISRIVIYKVDRLARSSMDYQLLRAFFKNLGISIVSVTEPFENNASGKLQETMLSAFAQFDNDVRSQRTLEGMIARLLKGLWSGIAPWGYINTLDEAKNKIIAPHPDKAPIVKMLFEKYATGKYTFKELSDLANKVGMKSRHGLKMSKQLVAKIVANPIYYGKIIVPKLDISVDGLHEPVIPEKLFMKTQDVRNGVVGRKNPRNLGNPEYPLRGIRCGGCGKNISGGGSTGKMKKRYKYYGCYNSECKITYKGKHSINKADLEKDFTDFLAELTPNDDLFDVLKEAIRLAHKSELSSVVTAERKLNLEIAQLEARKTKLLDLRVLGEIQTDDFTSANDKCNVRIAELKKEVSELSSPELGLDSIIDSSLKFLKNLPVMWKSLNVKDLRVLRALLFPENVEYHYPSIKTPFLCCIYNIKSEFLCNKNHWVTLQRIEL